MNFDASPPGSADESFEARPEAYVYEPVAPFHEPAWQTRLNAILILLLLVTSAAFAVALSIYQIAHVLNGMIQGYLGR